MHLDELRSAARSFFDLGVRAADPARSVSDSLTKRPLPVLPNGRHLVIAVGKAACPMAESALACLPSGAEFFALAVTNDGNETEIEGCTVLSASHPTPDERGLAAAHIIMQHVKAARDVDHVLFLISGGGSSLLPCPLPTLTLADKSRTNDILLGNGFDITETNLIRQQLSLLKGGGLRRLAEPAHIRTLAVSDVVGDDPRTIASGPTAEKLGTTKQAVALLKSKGVWAAVPESVRTILEEPDPLEPSNSQLSDFSVICSNQNSLQSIANSAANWNTQIVSSQLSGDVADAADQIARFIKERPACQKQLLIWGGETTVNLKGNGRGGRNQELAVRFAMQAKDLPGNWVFLSGGTDGRDGPTDAAGGIVDFQSLDRLAAREIPVEALLANNDSNRILDGGGDLLVTGPTGTNVADIQLFLRV